MAAHTGQIVTFDQILNTRTSSRRTSTRPGRLARGVGL
jgi:hypothetical protein